jgi:hypothetical protein
MSNITVQQNSDNSEDLVTPDIDKHFMTGLKCLGIVTQVTVVFIEW